MSTHRGRQWLFRIVTAIAAPVLFFGLLEVGLRLFGYGRPTSFAIPGEVNGRPVYTRNPQFTWHFFSREIARLARPFAYRVEKSAGTVRIFVLGASAAMGDPDPLYNFGRLLRVLLRDRYPQVTFEIINTGIVATNSHVVRETALQVAGHDPDLVIVYLGNNEVVGPFGAGNPVVPLSNSMAVIRARLALKKTRVGQLIEDAVHAVRGDSNANWLGMRQFLEHQVRHDDANLQRAYDHFRTNLEAVAEACRGRQVPLMLCTIAVNLRDSAPFASLHRPGLTADELDRWTAHFEQGVGQQESERFGEALRHYEAAAAIDDAFAELHYRVARCRWKLREFDEARSSFVRARDLDTLRFRADTRINDVICEIAGEVGADGSVRLVDAAAAFGQASPHGVPGEELFFEHVHFNLAGSDLLARTVLPAVEELLPAFAALRADAGEPPGHDEVFRRVALTHVDRMLLLQEMTRRLAKAPFTHQADHEARDHRLQDRVTTTLRRVETPPQLLAVYRKAVELDPDNWLLRDRFAIHLKQQLGDPAEAERQLGVVLQHVRAPEILDSLADALLLQERPGEALPLLREAASDLPRHLTIRWNLARALLGTGHREEAIAEFRRALGRAPAMPDLRFDYADALRRVGRSVEAIEQFELVLRLTPGHAGAHRALGHLREIQKRFDLAVAHYEQALALDPRDLASANNLSWLLATCPDLLPNDGRRAVEVAEGACRATEHRNPRLLDTLAVACARAGQFERAIKNAGRAISLLGPEETELAQRIRGRLKLFEQGEAYEQ